ncbi:hypothetical protein OROHE_001253 [Orobanche hederae]
METESPMPESGILTKTEADTKDLINELPSCILSHILSFLTIKDAVGTSIVSRYWLHPSLTRPHLEFDIPNIFGSRYVDVKPHPKDFPGKNLKLLDQFKTQDFVRCVNAFLGLYLGTKVNSLRVSFPLDGESAQLLDDCVRFAIEKGVEVLDFNLVLALKNIYVFPHQLLSGLKGSSLKHLSLGICILSPPPDFDGFQQLRTLCLDGATVDQTFLANLFSLCLFLENLSLTECRLGSYLSVAGPVLRLKSLKVSHCQKLTQIEISAPVLVSLEYFGPARLSFIRTPQLARIYYKPLRSNKLAYALADFASFPLLQTLHLHICPGVEIPQNPSTLGNLKRLDLDVYMTRKASDLGLVDVLNLLMAAPLLEELTISVIGPAIYMNQEVQTLSGFTHDNLRRVWIQGFQSYSYEIEFAICVIKNAMKLEMLVINPFGKVYMGGEIRDVISLYGYATLPKGCPSSSWQEERKRLWEQERRKTVQEELSKIEVGAQIIIM